MAITSHSESASASRSVGPNGTRWSSRFSTSASGCLSNQTTGPHNIEFGNSSEGYTVSFDGYVATSNPCYSLESDFEKTGNNTYTLNVTTVQENGTCVQCLGAVGYEASFTDDKPFRLEVVHDGEPSETLTHPGYPPGNGNGPGDQEPRGGFFSSFFRFLGGLF